MSLADRQHPLFFLLHTSTPASSDTDRPLSAITAPPPVLYVPPPPPLESCDARPRLLGKFLPTTGLDTEKTLHIAR